MCITFVFFARSLSLKHWSKPFFSLQKNFGNWSMLRITVSSKWCSWKLVWSKVSSAFNYQCFLFLAVGIIIFLNKVYISYARQNWTDQAKKKFFSGVWPFFLKNYVFFHLILIRSFLFISRFSSNFKPRQFLTKPAALIP